MTDDINHTVDHMVLNFVELENILSELTTGSWIVTHVLPRKFSFSQNINDVIVLTFEIYMLK